MIISLIKKKLLYLQCQTDKYMFNKRKSMPTKEEVKTAYRNLNRVIKAISEDKDIPEWGNTANRQTFRQKTRNTEMAI